MTIMNPVHSAVYAVRVTGPEHCGKVVAEFADRERAAQCAATLLWALGVDSVTVAPETRTWYVPDDKSD